MVRQRMMKPILKRSLGLLLVLSSLLAFTACNPTEISSAGVRSSSITNSDGKYNGAAYVYADSPAIIGGAGFPISNPNMDKIINKSNPQLVTTNAKLTGNCSVDFYFYGVASSALQDCIHSLASSDSTSIPGRAADNTFIFPTGSSEFYQTNALYHLQLAKDMFLRKLQYSFNTVHALPLSIPKSIPNYLASTGQYWFKGVTNQDSQNFKNSYLTSYALCNLEQNASYNPAGPSLCFGYFKAHPGLYFVQDPSVIYHEFGHAMVDIMMNLRNSTVGQSHKYRSSLVSLGSEASAINEGIADYVSFVMNKRTHIGEWALGRSSKQSRPMTESDKLHISALSETSEGRLSYPDYLLYDANNPDKPHEDVHYAGQIVSHYLVALTKTLKNKCGFTSDTDGGHDRATNLIVLLLSETLSELGDLNAKGVDDFGTDFISNNRFNNLDDENSFLWTHFVNPISYRRFFQTFAKNSNKYVSNHLCLSHSIPDSEKLLDDYGLLLFKTYNDNGNSTKDRHATFTNAVSDITDFSLTGVDEGNRRKSTLISKQQLELVGSTAHPGVEFYIIDNKNDINGLLNSILWKGFALPLSTRVAGTVYNNNNIKISPGEIVALIPNLLNTSNSTMAGVQILANDWDHVQVTSTATGHFKPCKIDEVTTVDQGAYDGCDPTDTEYRRLVQNKVTKLFPPKASAPVCMVQLDDGTSSKWVSQSEYRKKTGLALLDRDCLGYSTSTSSVSEFNYNPHECLVRFLPGATTAHFSKISPQKTYYQSVVEPSTTKKFNASNLLMMEVNKWVPPGTKFRCRLRARFSNCDDCYTDPANGNDDYLDYEYNGAKPFKVMNFDFDVND